MLRKQRRWLTVLLGLLLAGCSRTTVEAPEAPPDTQTRLGEATAIDLAAWLQLPRADLAKLADEWTETVRAQREAIHTNPASADLLPGLLPPPRVAVFHQATFSPAAGVSLPPYLAPGTRDAAVALHLARWSDHHAAARLADPKDTVLAGRLTALRGGRQLPVEWTRLVSLVLNSSQLKLSMGDVDGANQLVALHRQLRGLLDGKNADGPPAALLLASGKLALEKAAAAWRDPKRNKVALVEDLEAALADWGTPPALTLPFAAPAVEVSALLGAPIAGKTVAARTPAAVARAMDLLASSLPVEGAEVVVAFLDANDRLARLLVGYQSAIDRQYPNPAQLAYHLLEAGATGQDEEKSAALVQQRFSSGAIHCDVLRTNRSPALGALVQLTPVKGEAAARPRSLRDFGPVHLDRGFEASRVAIAPGLLGPSINTNDSAVLERVARTLETPRPSLFLLHRDRARDVVTGLEMSWKTDENRTALSRLLPSLWDDYGPGRVDAVEDAAGSYLAFTWTDDTTRVQLRLAFDERGPILSVHDVQDATRLPERQQLAQRRDTEDRQARLKAGKPDTRLPRSPGDALDRLQLGQPRAEALATLPEGEGFRRADVPGGVSLVLTTPAPAAVPYLLRQVLLRFTDDRLSEIRLRYAPGTAAAKKGESLLDQLSDARAGIGLPITARWAGLWADQPEPGAALSLRWTDDRTVRLYNQDTGGYEVILHDRPAGAEQADPQSWAFLPAGAKGASLGDTRAAVRAALNAPALQNNGADVHRMPAASPYEMLLVWYEGDRVSRLVAVHREKPKGNTATDAATALARAWGRELTTLGFYRRTEPSRDGLLGAYFWNDDRVRVQLSVQDDGQGARLTTEWRFWPIGGKATPLP